MTYPDLRPILDRTDMRRALAERDIAALYRLLQRHGISQRKIGAMTEQSQSEISEILGGRHVVAYDVLVRIATGLGIERGYLGLAYDDETAEFIASLRSTTPASTTTRSVPISERRA
jgi:transcriptional regulator with XRE-family HTH domain